MKLIPKLLSLISLWSAVGVVLVYVEPELIRDIIIHGLYLPFFGLLTLAIWYTLSLFLKSFFISLLFSMTIIAGLILTMLHLMHWGLLAVLLLTFLIESWYTYNRYEKINSTNEQKNRGTGI